MVKDPLEAVPTPRLQSTRAEQSLEMSEGCGDATQQELWP